MRGLKKFFAGFGLGLIAIAGVVVLMLLPWPVLVVLVLALAAWMAFTRRGRQAWSVTWVGISTLPQRLGASSVVVIGIAGVVGVLVALLALGEGFQETMKETGSDDTAIVLRSGALTELNSVLDHDTTALIGQAAGVLKDDAGRAISSPELVVVASLPKKASGLDANVEIRGVGEEVWKLRPDVRIIEGRTFKPGLRELIVGKGALAEFDGTGIGSKLKLNSQEWTIVGTFDAGDAHDSELWGDADVVASTYRRGSSRTTVLVRLTGADAFDAFKAAIASDPRLKVDVKTTRAYYNEQSEGLTKLIRILGTTIAVIMGIGAIFGALNTMYAAVATRAREIATLRAIGFRGLPVVVSVLLETMLLALAGGVLGALIAWALFNNYTVSTLGSNFSQVVFAFKVSPALVWSGLKWALAIGFIGGLFPALRAARLPVTTALREL
ncbi:MAG TPA: ABC transporter permease [Rhodanobacteraceae bacterium]|jgi:putative ABC transport system permease protein|nr:ABC transporter permease [Rhodanobacteraceae bacterium]